MRMNKTNIVLLSGYFSAIVAWIATLGIDAYSFDHGLTGLYYYLLFIPWTIVFIMSCILVSIDSHKRLIENDSKESGSSIMFMFFYNVILVASLFLHEKDIVNMVIAGANDKKTGTATIYACSFFLIVSGVIGMFKRRKFTNVATIVSLIMFALAIYVLAKNYP